MTRTFVFLALACVIAVLAWQVRAGAPEPLLPEGEWQDAYERWDLEAIIVAPGFYTVQDGEQLFHVAAKYKLPGPVQLTIDVLKEINNLWDRPILRPGQRLRVPETDPSQWPIWAGQWWGQDTP